nr:uncharacterized protein LOC129381481 [Dermacentor andersoni]
MTEQVFFPIDGAVPEPLTLSAHVARFAGWERDRDRNLDLDALDFPPFPEPVRLLERERPLDWHTVSSAVCCSVKAAAMARAWARSMIFVFETSRPPLGRTMILIWSLGNFGSLEAAVTCFMNLLAGELAVRLPAGIFLLRVSFTAPALAARSPVGAPPLACRCRHNIFWRRGWDSRSGSDRSPGTPTSFAHLEAAGGGDWTDARRASALVSALGREGQRKYFADEEQEAARQLTGAASPSSEAARQSTGAASTSSDAVPPASEFPRLLERLDRLFAASTNVLAERHEFTSRKQFDGEGFLEFVTALKEKAVQCNFGTTYGERVRDQIIHGVANVSVREKLLAHGETLTLDKAEEIGRSLEALHRANRAFGSEKIQRIEAAQLGAPSTSQDGRRSPGGHDDVQETTQLTPFELVYGRNPTMTLDAVLSHDTDEENLDVPAYLQRTEEA